MRQIFMFFLIAISSTNFAFGSIVSFEATNFLPDINSGVPSPVDTVTGSFEYRLGPTGDFELINFNTSILGVAYGSTNVDFVATVTPDYYIIGGNPDGPDAISSTGTDDFAFTFELTPGIMRGFSIAVSDIDGIWTSMDVVTTVSNVPVPAAVWLMGSGLLGLMGFSRKNKTQAIAA